MNTTQIRAALKTLGFQVKLSRRNGLGQPVSVTVIRSRPTTVVLSGEGANDLEAFQAVFAQVEALS